MRGRCDTRVGFDNDPRGCEIAHQPRDRREVADPVAVESSPGSLDAKDIPRGRDLSARVEVREEGNGPPWHLCLEDDVAMPFEQRRIGPILDAIRTTQRLTV